MITLDNVTKFYNVHGKREYIIKGSSLVIPNNVNVAILGKKGSGRTTLLKMLAGIDYPTSGNIDSNNTFSWIVGDVSGFKKEITVRQNIKFVGRIYGKSEDEIDEIIGMVDEFSEMGTYLDKPMKECPKVTKSQIAFGLSLAFDFDYLLIDRKLAVSAGDNAIREKSKKALRNKIKTCNVLLVTDKIQDIQEICDVCIVIDSHTLYYFDNIEDGIIFYRQLTDFSPPLRQTAVKGTIFCDDGNNFRNIGEAAKYYNVNELSILQAINFNRGSHVYLKKVFWSESGSATTFQNWPYIKENETLLASDGIIFKDVYEASKFYQKNRTDVKIGQNHIEMMMKNYNGHSKVLDMTFNYLREREL